MSDELPDPWAPPAYGGGGAPPPPVTRPIEPGGGAGGDADVTPPAGSDLPTGTVPVVRSGGGPLPPVGPPGYGGGDGGDAGGGADRRKVVLAVGVVVLALLAAVILVLALQGGEDSEETTDTTVATTASSIDEVVTTTVVAEETTTVVEDVTTTAPPTTEATTTTLPATTTTVPASPDGWPIGLTVAVAAPDGVRVLGAAGANTVAVAEPVQIAVPIPGTQDFVVQSASGRYSGASEAQTAIRRIGPSGQSVLFDPLPGTWLRVHDVRLVGGNPVLVYSTDQGDTPENQEERLYLYRLADGSSADLGVIGGWESSTGRLHLGGVTVLGEFFAEVLSGLMTAREDGTTIDPASVGLAEFYTDCSTCPRRYAITPNGQRIVWLDVNDLVVVDIGTGTELQRVTLPETVATVASDVALANDIAIVNRTASSGLNDTHATAVIVDLRGPAPVLIELSAPGFAIAR